MTGVDPDFDFQATVDRMLLCVRLLADDVDLGQIRSVVAMADAVGAFVDPTKYRDALQRGDMRRVERLAELLEPVVAYWWEEVVPSLPEEQQRILRA